MINYDKTHWIDRETIVDADKLNKLEDAIEYMYDISKDVPRNEESRIASENTRKENEEARKSSHSSMVTSFDNKIKEVDNAKNDLVSNVSSTINNKIAEVNRVKDSLATTVANKITEIDGFVNIKNAEINDKKQELDTRFSQLTSQQQQDAEVVDARTGVTGKTYTSIKDRIDSIELSPAILFETVEG